MERRNGLPEGKELDVSEDDVQAQMEFLAVDPKHQHERPYELRYDAGGAIPETSVVEESKQVLIRNFRPFQNAQSFDEYGFAAMKIDCAMTAVDFDEKDKIKDIYYPAIMELLRQRFPDAAHINVLEHVVSAPRSH